jgi:UDP-3-O-[3-hydroxymyristoyl] N-acetylglucosamine deacetylase/3-hydroxyacyl-[acyl-carrier-protein] dehydratase
MDGAGMTTARRKERTLAREAEVRGVSFLSGLDVAVRFRPAPAGTGRVFVRRDLPGGPEVPAHVGHVIPRQRRTTLRRGEAIVEMVEHVLAALAGLHIDNCRIEVDGPETPGLDGSSLGFVEALDAAGAVEQDRPRDVLVVGAPVAVREGGSSVAAHPGPADELVLSYSLDYGPSTPIGRQSQFVAVTPESFRRELASSRTFLLAAEADALRAAGIGRRTTAKDLLIFGPDGPIENAVRFPDECVRHKILDMVGDLALAGKDLVGHVVAHKSGHTLNAALVRAILAAAEAEEAPPALDIGQIMRVMPHRYPFLLVDRVLAIEPGERVLALKNVTANEPYFTGHWPGQPVMPGVLIVEALAQAGGLLIAGWADPQTHLAMIAAIDGVKLRRPVVPGDQVRLEVEALRKRTHTAEMRGVARVGKRVVAEARIRFMIVEKARVA